jgi:O-acetylserine/cysteine efflux transporter
MTVFSLAFQVYAATHFSYWGWNLLLREYPISRVAPLSLLIPVFGIFSSMAILGQHPSPAEWGLILLVLVAIVLGSGYLQGLLSRRRARIA